MRFALAAVALALAVSPARAVPTPASTCIGASGDEAARCLESFLGGGSADPAFTDTVVTGNCSDDTSYVIGSLGADDLVLVLRNACADFGAELLALATASETAPGTEDCQEAITARLGTLRTKTIALLGPKCSVKTAEGRRCKRTKQDARAAQLARKTAKKLQKACPKGTAEALGFPPVDELVATYLDRVRHFAMLAYPPNALGPSGELGPHPVGTRTLALEDAARMNVDMTGPRPVTVDVWYPSTPEAVAGVERYVVNLFGFDVARTPTYLDVARAPGAFPLVLFSHGNAGIRFQSIFLATQLASHGYVVVSPDHHGNTFLDLAAGDVDAASATNRPLDMRFVLDEMLARNGTGGDFFEGAIDAARIGMTGHSFGGFTTWALAAGPTADARIGAFMPLAPASVFEPAFFGSVTSPVLVQGGSLDGTTPFDTQQLAPFQSLPSGARVVGLAEIVGAGHFSFSDVCEVPRNLVGAIGGFDEACTPEHLPWRQAHDVINYLATNFFDATLRGDAQALRNLQRKALASIPDLNYQSK